MPATSFERIAFPNGTMEPRRDGTAHQRMIGRMIFDEVDPVALPVVRAQFRQLCIGKTREVLRFRRHHETASLLQIGMQLLRETRRNLHQKRITQIGIVARHGRRLVGNVVRFQKLVPYRVIQSSAVPVLTESLEPLYLFVFAAFPNANPFHTFAGNALAYVSCIGFAKILPSRMQFVVTTARFFLVNRPKPL